MATDPYKIVILDAMPGDEGKSETTFLELLFNRYRRFYEILDEKRCSTTNKISRVARFEIEVKPTGSKDALQKNLQEIRESTVSPSGIHFIGHGCYCKKSRATVIEAGEDKVNLRVKQDLALFDSLGSGWMLFSCCDIGEDQHSLKKLRDISKRDAVFAFKYSANPSLGKDDEKELFGYQAFMVAAMFYHLALVPYQNFGKSQDDISWQLLSKRLRTAVRGLEIGATIRGSY